MLERELEKVIEEGAITWCKVLVSDDLPYLVRGTSHERGCGAQEMGKSAFDKDACCKSDGGWNNRHEKSGSLRKWKSPPL